jgi:hypothetical protein
VISDPVDEFFSLDDFAEQAEYTPVGGSMSLISVIFDAAYSQSIAGGVEFQNLGPRASCKAADVEGVTKSATLRVQGTLYYVIDIQADGHGLVDLSLSKDA